MESNDTFKEFRTTVQKLVCISHTRPEIIGGVNILARVKNEKFQKKGTKITSTLSKHLNQHPKLGLIYEGLD